MSRKSALRRHPRFGLILSSLIGITIAHADDFKSEAALPEPEATPVVIDRTDITRKLQFLVYYPHQNEFVFTANTQAPIDAKSTTTDSLGIQTKSSSTNYSQLTLALAAALDDRYRVGLSATELFSQTTVTNDRITSTTNTDKANGPSCPQFSFTYRAVNNRANNIFADISFSFIPQMAIHKAATANQVGDNWATSWSTSLNFPFYWVHRRHEFEIEPQATYHFSGESQGPSLVSTFELSDYWTGALLFADRYHITSLMHIEPMLTLNFPNRSNITNLNTNIDTNTSNSLQLIYQIQLGYLLNKVWLVNLTVAYSSGTRTVTPSNASPSEVDTKSTLATLGTRFAF